MSSYPIAGNQYFSSVNNTVVTTASVNEALTVADIRPLKYVQGTVTPTAIGNYAVVDSSSNNVVLPSNALISHIFIRGSLTAAAGTTLQPYLGATAGAATTALTAAGVVYTDVNLGEVPAVSETTGSTNTFLTIKTAVGAVSAGSATVTVLYYDSPS